MPNQDNLLSVNKYRKHDTSAISKRGWYMTIFPIRWVRRHITRCVQRLHGMAQSEVVHRKAPLVTDIVSERETGRVSVGVLCQNGFTSAPFMQIENFLLQPQYEYATDALSVYNISMENVL
jgi:hypothetical protein